MKQRQEQEGTAVQSIFVVVYGLQRYRKLRNDDDYSYVAAWEFDGVGEEPTLHKEPLSFPNVPPTTRSYK